MQNIQKSKACINSFTQEIYNIEYHVSNKSLEHKSTRLITNQTTYISLFRHHISQFFLIQWQSHSAIKQSYIRAKSIFAFQ